MRLSKTITDTVVSIALKALGDGDSSVSVTEDEVIVNVLVDKMVFGEVRIQFESFESQGHWEVHQSVSLWNTRLSAHQVGKVASLLVDVGARVRLAETLVEGYLRQLPGTRVSSEFAPIQL
jgi:hypothetical protein